MKYLRLYEKFRRLTENQSVDISKLYNHTESKNSLNKELILLSGPSASGKTYYAKNTLGVVSWLDSGLNSDAILVGTDSIQDNRASGVISKLFFERGLPVLSKIMEKFPDSFFTFESYKDIFSEWYNESSETEKRKYEEMRPFVGYDLKKEGKCERCKTTEIRNEVEDGRVSGMAWVAYLHPAKTIYFDDIDITINNFYTGVKEWLMFTPLNFYLDNIETRNNSRNTGEHISLTDESAGIYQYMRWYSATENQSESIDNKFYPIDSVKSSLIRVGYDADVILKKLGVSSDSSGFYISPKKINSRQGDVEKTINTREQSR